VDIREGAISLEELRKHLNCNGTGAFVSFEGVVRPEEEGKRVDEIYYECYREMALKKMREIVSQVLADGIQDAGVIHRVGRVGAGEVSIVAGVCSKHRKEAFEACMRIVSEIKEKVPIWKKEIGEVTRWK